MSLSVITEKSTLDAKKAHGTVVVASDRKQGNLAIQELQSTAARNLAISYAQEQGMSTAGVSATFVVYPVNADGEPLESIGGVAPAAYRADIPVTARQV